MKQIALHLVVMATIVVTACSPVVYSTVGQNVPLFHQKGEVTGYAGLASTSDANGLALQVAGSTSDHFALMSSFYTMSSKTTEEDNWSGKGSYWEFGLGGFGSLSNSNPNFRFEAFAGLGLGKIENHKADEAVNLKFVKPFIQPSFGYSAKWFEAAFTPRFALVSYTGHEFVFNGINDFETRFNEGKTTFVFEPGITLRSGYKGIKLQVQYNYSSFDPFEPDPDGNKPNINEDFFSIGIHYTISKRFKDY